MLELATIKISFITILNFVNLVFLVFILIPLLIINLKNSNKLNKLQKKIENIENLDITKKISILELKSEDLIRNYQSLENIVGSMELKIRRSSLEKTPTSEKKEKNTPQNTKLKNADLESLSETKKIKSFSSIKSISTETKRIAGVEDIREKSPQNKPEEENFSFNSLLKKTIRSSNNLGLSEKNIIGKNSQEKIEEGKDLSNKSPETTYLDEPLSKVYFEKTENKNCIFVKSKGAIRKRKLLSYLGKKGYYFFYFYDNGKKERRIKSLDGPKILSCPKNKDNILLKDENDEEYGPYTFYKKEFFELKIDKKYYKIILDRGIDESSGKNIYIIPESGKKLFLPVGSIEFEDPKEIDKKQKEYKSIVVKV